MEIEFNKFYTPTEAAGILRLTPVTVRDMIHGSELPAIRVGKKKILILGADLAKIITPLGTQGDGDDVAA